MISWLREAQPCTEAAAHLALPLSGRIFPSTSPSEAQWMQLSQRCCGASRRLDGLVACAGVGLAGSLEDTEDDEAKRNFDTNFFGTARMIRAVLPTMRKQSCGKVVVIGSIGGLIGLPFVPYYSASKFALDGLIEALRGEVAPFGIQVTIVHPGDLNTTFGANRILSRNVGTTSAYQGRFQDTLQFYAAQESNAASPQTLARKVEKLLSKRSLPARVIVGTPLEKLGVSGKRYLPARSFEYLLRKAYAP